jgi:hypothetical protein
MKSCFIFCSDSLEKAQKGLENIKEHYKKKSLSFPFTAVIKEAHLDVMYPYWVGIIFDKEHMRDVDEWVCEFRIPSDEVCAGVARYRELRDTADILDRYDFWNGTIISENDMKEVEIEWDDE